MLRKDVPTFRLRAPRTKSQNHVIAVESVALIRFWNRDVRFSSRGDTPYANLLAG